MSQLIRCANLFKFNVRNYVILKQTKCCSDTPKNVRNDFQTAQQQTENGAIYDKKPFKMICEAGKKYSWCLCGKSKNQPLCDGTHKSTFLKIKQRPVKFEVPETKPYYLCNCKQTANRPFCDGTHKQEFVQQAVKS